MLEKKVPVRLLFSQSFFDRVTERYMSNRHKSLSTYIEDTLNELFDKEELYY